MRRLAAASPGVWVAGKMLTQSGGKPPRSNLSKGKAVAERMDFQSGDAWVRRHQRLIRQLETAEVDGLLVGHPPNLRYLFDFDGSAGLALCLRGQCTLLVDGRYYEAARDEARHCRIKRAPQSLEQALEALLREEVDAPGVRLGFESRHLTVEDYQRLEGWPLALEWQPTSGLVEQLRSVKDAAEVSAVQQAVNVAQRALETSLARIPEERTEADLAALLEFELRRQGADAPAFETIVAAGAHSSLPHARARHHQIPLDQSILIDFGARCNGYHSDLTRLICPAGAEIPDIAGVVREAQQAAIDAIRPGAVGSEVDGAARRIIERAGLGEFFSHGTGHGLGLEVHEMPRISPRFDDVLREGMIVTVEPGIYLPGKVGVRLEEVVLITRSGSQVLSDRSRQIISLPA